MRFHYKKCFASCLIFAVCFASGCYWRRDNHPAGTIQGIITSNGQPVTEGEINFFDAETGFGMNASINSDGSYRVTSKVWTGKYVVSVTPPVPLPGDSSQPAPPRAEKRDMKTMIPKKYREDATTPLSTEVVEGKNVLNFDLVP